MKVTPPSSNSTPAESQDPLRGVVKGLLDKIAHISSSGVTLDLVEDLLSVVRKHGRSDGDANSSAKFD